MSTNTTVQCDCHHLTNFAILLDHTNAVEALSAADKAALEYITLIGCSISIVLMTVTILVFAIYAVWAFLLF